MDTQKICHGKTLMIAHRGLSGIEKENTLPAFVAAGNRSYFGIETDVHKTKDGKYVLLHDNNPMRVSGVSMNVCEEAFDKVRSVEIDDNHSDGSTGSRIDLRIPTLDEYVTICRRYNKYCILELKDNFDEASVAEICSIIDAHGYLQNTVIISFIMENLLIFKKLYPNSPAMFLCGSVSEDIWDILIEKKIGIDIYEGGLSDELIDRAHKNGLSVNCWTVDNPENAMKYVGMGVDYITTDILE